MALDLYTKFTTKRAEKNSSLKNADLGVPFFFFTLYGELDPLNFTLYGLMSYAHFVGPHRGPWSA
eukprot:SAG11_NODE_3939_length_2133_cov_3.073457_1_plen_65_part_00